jgi:hypothetical protein
MKLLRAIVVIWLSVATLFVHGAPQQIDGDHTHTLYIDKRGEVMAMGESKLGQLGPHLENGKMSHAPFPVGITGARGVAAAAYRSLVLLEDGTVMYFGAVDDYVISAVPQPVPGLNGTVIDIAANNSQAFFLVAEEPEPETSQEVADDERMTKKERKRQKHLAKRAKRYNQCMVRYQRDVERWTKRQERQKGGNSLEAGRVQDRGEYVMVVVDGVKTFTSRANAHRYQNHQTQYKRSPQHRHDNGARPKFKCNRWLDDVEPVDVVEASVPQGKIWAWEYSTSNPPVLVSDVNNFVQISARGAQVGALTADGKVWMGGNNRFGQLGIGSTDDSDVLIELTNLPEVKQISLGDFHTVALTKSGDMYTWGLGHDGRLGDGKGLETNRGWFNDPNVHKSTVPQRVSNLYNVEKVSAGKTHTVALKSGDVYAFGYSNYTGNGMRDKSAVPIKVEELSQIEDVGVGSDQTIVSDGYNTRWGWGGSQKGKLGTGDYRTQHQPKEVLPVIEDTQLASAY